MMRIHLVIPWMGNHKDIDVCLVDDMTVLMGQSCHLYFRKLENISQRIFVITYGFTFHRKVES